MENLHLKTILSNTYTWNDLHHHLGLLQEFVEQEKYIEHEQKTIRQSLEEFLSYAEENDETKSVFLAWGDSFFESLLGGSDTTALSHLLEAADELPTLKLYVPVVFPREEVARLAEWVRNNLASDTLIDLSIDPKLAVGCAFVWKGVYHDFSIQYYMHKHREEFVKKIRAYAEQVER